MAAITGAHQVLITKDVPLGASLKHIIPVSFWRHKEKKIRNAADFRSTEC